ncbi:hypothetical protein DPMN_142010 [Dreissena polymorpha]|uniref:Uncharacterized protein n=1 Tax=Dreissena polymorpha TaxID=45954 RepID=A0A9D4GAH0_DREPO|nr:hypothetical protein DPMN_142010 [Dreissena polymorpha]
MLTEPMTKITIDQSASGTFIMLTTSNGSRRRLTQIPRKKIVIVISRTMFTLIITTLQISTSATSNITYYRNDDDHRDDNYDYNLNNSKNKTNENDCNCYTNDLNNDSKDGNNHDCIDYLFNTNNNAEDEDCFKNQAKDYLSDINAGYCNDCNDDFYGYCFAGRKVDKYNSRWNYYNVRVQRYKNCRVYYRNNREDDSDDFLETDYIYSEEHIYDIDEAFETKTDSEHYDNAGDEDFSWGNDEMVNYTYTGSDGDYNCRDKQCCYESDDASIDDEDYFYGQELDVVTDSDHDDSNVHVYRDEFGYDVGDHDDSNIHVYRDDLGYDDGSYFDYDLYSDYDYSSVIMIHVFSRLLVSSCFRRFRETQFLYRANKIIGQSQTQIILKKQDTIYLVLSKNSANENVPSLQNF